MFEPFFTSKDKGKGPVSVVDGLWHRFPAGAGSRSKASQRGHALSDLFFAGSGGIEEIPPLFLTGASGDRDCIAGGGRGQRPRAGRNHPPGPGLPSPRGRKWRESAGNLGRMRGRIDILLTDSSCRARRSELAHKLRQSNPKLKVLFMSATPTICLPVTRIGGETQLIQKPFTAEALAESCAVFWTPEPEA